MVTLRWRVISGRLSGSDYCAMDSWKDQNIRCLIYSNSMYCRETARGQTNATSHAITTLETISISCGSIRRWSIPVLTLKTKEIP
ncbi:MAG: hypothetical protein ACI8PB_001239 [Desulforhopalus sp.]|jgi:hypothetical protein